MPCALLKIRLRRYRTIVHPGCLAFLDASMTDCVNLISDGNAYATVLAGFFAGTVQNTLEYLETGRQVTGERSG